jgi:hypothetical protein
MSEKNCINCYTLIFSVVFVLFGLCGTGFWYTVHRLDVLNDNLMTQNIMSSKYYRQIEINTSNLNNHIGLPYASR